MNNNHQHRSILTGNKNHHKVNTSNLEPIIEVQPNKKHYWQNSMLFSDMQSQIFEQSLNFDHSSNYVPQIKERFGLRQRVKTEIVKPKYGSQFKSQNKDQLTAYFPKLKERAQSDKKKKLQKLLRVKDLQKSLDYSRNPQIQQRDLTPIQLKTIEVSKSISQLDHINQEEIMQFSFGFQYNKMSIEKQKQKFPKDIFLGNVRKVKRILQQQ